MVRSRLVKVNVLIHPTAIVDPSALIGEGTSVGPYSVIGPNVRLGARNRLASHVVIEGFTEIGDDNQFYQFCSVGSAPQDLKYHGEPSRLKIGHRNIIREYATLQPGTEGGRMLTAVGDQNLFMASSHIGHDCQVGNRCVVANCAALAGHVTLGDGVIVGGLAAIHQFVEVGALTMIGGGAMVAQDIPPFCIAQGDRASLVGINRIGLERAGLASEEISAIKGAFRDCFVNREQTLKERATQALAAYSNSIKARELVEFILSSERGVASARE